MCQLFISKDFETSLLTLLGVSLVLWKRKADNALSTPVLWPSPLTSQHLHFQFLITSLLKIFVRSRRDWKEKMPGRISTESNLHITTNNAEFLLEATVKASRDVWKKAGKLSKVNYE
jgi:hypothetical protein